MTFQGKNATQLSIAGKKKTNKQNFKNMWNLPQNFRTCFAFLFFLHTSNIQSSCPCKIKVNLLVLGQDPYEDYRFSHIHSDGLYGYCDTILPFPDLLELAQFTHLLVVQIGQ